MKSLSDYEQKVDQLRNECPVRTALDVIRGRWKPSILFELKNGTKRFSDLQAALPEISGQALTVQLRQLEADSVISQTVYPEIPMKVEYTLSEHKSMLSTVMDQLEAWGIQHLKREIRIRSSKAAP